MSIKSVCIHQPNFLPWIGLIHKICISENYIVLDNVMFTRNQFQQRNSINTMNGQTRLSVPITKGDGVGLIKNIEISEHFDWRKKHLETIYYSYKKSKYFNEFYERLEQIYSQNYKKLIHLNVNIINHILDYLNVDANILFASDVVTRADKTLRLVDLCEATGVNAYIYGGTADYIVKEKFIEKGISLIPQSFIHPSYDQMHADQFTSNLSIVDWIFQRPKSEIIAYLDLEKEKFKSEKLKTNNTQYTSLV
ncbi:WbqC family protein [Bacillales bacterium AN1005]